MGWQDDPAVVEDDTSIGWQDLPAVVEPEGAGSQGAVLLLISMAPIVAAVGFLRVRAAAVRSKPEAERENARRALGVWTRLMIVFTFIWSGLLTAWIVFLLSLDTQIEASLVAWAGWTFGPPLALWISYFAAKWVKQGAKAG